MCLCAYGLSSRLWHCHLPGHVTWWSEIQPYCILQERAARLQDPRFENLPIPVEIQVDRDMKPPVRPASGSWGSGPIGLLHDYELHDAPASSACAVCRSAPWLVRMPCTGFASPHSISAPCVHPRQVYVYYSLHSFYQNHKRYVRSRNDAQLAGKTTAPGVKCQPEQFLGGNQAQPINPCGLIAWSLFNDSFTANVSGPAGVQSKPLTLSVRAPARQPQGSPWYGCKHRTCWSKQCLHCAECAVTHIPAQGVLHQLTPLQVHIFISLKGTTRSAAAFQGGCECA